MSLFAVVDSLHSQLRLMGKSAIFVQADIRDPTQAQQVIDQCMAQTQRLDILVNNAGGSPPIESATASPGITDKIIQLNLVASIDTFANGPTRLCL